MEWMEKNKTPPKRLNIFFDIRVLMYSLYSPKLLVITDFQNLNYAKSRVLQKT